MRASLVGFVVLAACEAQPHVHVTFRGALEPAKLHVEGCAESTVQPCRAWGPSELVSERIVPGGIDVEISLAIGPRWLVRLRGWYDANGNGRRDPGEPAGALGSAFEARDSGGCSPRDANRAPDIVLAPGGAGSAW